jgi:hypothetical protein
VVHEPAGDAGHSVHKRYATDDHQTSSPPGHPSNDSGHTEDIYGWNGHGFVFRVNMYCNQL